MTEVKINESREKYRICATRGALLFFMLNSLNKVHAFYAFSLNAFVTVFALGHRPCARWEEEESQAFLPNRGEACHGKVRLEHGSSFSTHSFEENEWQRGCFLGRDSRANA